MEVTNLPIYHSPIYQLPNLLTDFYPLLLALSPFAILFAPTAFLDPTMVILALA